MSLDVYLEVTQPCRIFHANITHNLTDMADACGLYEALWRPDEINAVHARDLIPTLRDGLQRLKEDPYDYRQYDSPNGWGTYEHFVPFVEQYLKACEANPSATVSVCR